MRKKRQKLFTPVLLLFLSVFLIANVAVGKSKSSHVKALQRELELRAMEDSLLSQVKIEDLLDDEVYQKLAYEGWTPPEIIRIMNTALTDKVAARNKAGYGEYAKRWLPDYALVPGNDSLYMVVDSAINEETRRNVMRSVPEDIFNAYWEPLPYLPPRDRTDADRRNAGYFRQPKFKPSVGRMSSIVLHPENPDMLYVVPSGSGIFRTEDLGQHWENISDRIPNRYDRLMGGYGIPVDPDDFDHVFHFAGTGNIWESFDGGKSWEQVPGAVNKGFKRAFCFKDKAGNLKFFGCTRGNPIWTTSTLWVSEDKGVTWTAVALPDSIKDTHAYAGLRGTWFQEVVQDPADRDKIYFPTTRSIFYFDDGAKSEIVNGRKVYNLKKMHFEVYDAYYQNRRWAEHPMDMGRDPEHKNDAIFPCPSTQPGNLLINPNNPDQWWFATACIQEFGVPKASAIFRSEDHGKTWETMNDLNAGIGSGCAFGHTVCDGWLGGFAVNFKDTNYVYGCNTTCASSADGGRNFRDFGWHQSLRALHEDGRWIANSYSRHNSDNHYMASHKSGRIFRASDGGMLCVDQDINNGIWFQMGGDMGQMMFYHVAVNEFGDQVIFGNTQDTDGQTYRYGRWGRWRGYEGSEAWVNPYSGTTYISSGGTGGFDTDYMTFSSWNNGWTKADVVTGSWFLSRSGGGAFNGTFQRCDDLGQRTVNLEAIIGESVGVFGKFGLCRDKGLSTVYVLTSSNTLRRSIDGGKSFEPVLFNGQPARFSNTVIATDPNNSDIVYLGQHGSVKRLYVNESRYEEVGTGLPSIGCSQLMFHEGSGDLYFHHTGSGIYILEYDKESGQYAPQWRYWTKGYNLAKSRNAVINYTTQEMVISDFGTGVWCADLEHPSDRFFDNGFALKEFSFKDGRHTIGIDTEWTIPLYYYFKWTVNGREITESPYQYLRRRLNPGDRVQLELTLRESPDVKTLSTVFVVPETGNTDSGQDAVRLADGRRRTGESGGISFDNPVVKESGRAILSNGLGRIDLGYFDYFFNDFTIDFWIRPLGDGTILANTHRTGHAKGFDMYVEQGRLKFAYYPKNVFSYPNYETAPTQGGTLQGNLSYNTWSHVALTHQRNGMVTLYINGVRQQSVARVMPESTLNSGMILSLFGDGIERNPLTTYFDELKIWTRALTEEEVRCEMYSTNCENSDGLAAYWSFNGGAVRNEVEEFSRHGMKPRVLGGGTYFDMTVPTCASSVIYESINGLDHTFKKGDMNVLGITPAASRAAAPAAAPDSTAAAPARAAADVRGAFGVYTYDALRWKDEEDNLDTDFYEYQPVGYLIHAFDKVTLTDAIDLDFYPCGGVFDPEGSYRFYVSDPDLEKQVWERMGRASYNTETGSVTVTGLSLNDVVDKKLLVVTTRPAIEASVVGVGEDGILNIFEDSQNTAQLTATVLGNIPKPTEIFNISPNGILLASGLKFSEDKEDAEGILNLDLSKLGSFNSLVRTTLRSKDNPIQEDGGITRSSFIPLTIDVRNRITPTALGKGLVLNKASVEIGTDADFKSLLTKKDLTIMGWVRIDDPAILETANYSLMTFRDRSNRMNGIILDAGKIVLAMNGSKMTTTAQSLTFTEEDLGNWVHVAVVISENPKRVQYYKNGIFYGLPAVAPAIGSGVGPFCLGKNSAQGASTNADNFSGAFDQIAVWTRAITQDEVFKYMYTAPALNDPGLILFANMDYTDRAGVHRDCYSDGEIKLIPTKNLGGTASFDEISYLPYETRVQTKWNDTEAIVSLAYPGSKNSRYSVVSTFRGTPHNYYDSSFEEYIPLSKEYYSITFLQGHNPTLYGDTVEITYRNPIIMQGDKLAVGMRRIGTMDHLSGFVHGTAPEPGIAVFKVPSTFVQYSTEIMFFMYPSEGDPTGGRLSNVRFAFAPSVLSKLKYNEGDDVPILELEHGVDSIPVVADIIHVGRYTEQIEVTMENEGQTAKFASSSQKSLDLSLPTNHFCINIDRTKTDRFGLNDLVIDIENVYTEKPLHLKFYFRPYVQLSLVDDEHGTILTPEPGGPSVDPEEPDPIPDLSDEQNETNQVRRRATSDTEETPGHTYTARTPVPSFEIKAQLLEGFLPEGTEVEFDITSDMPTSLHIGNGSLLQDQSVTIDGLEYHESYVGSRQNPFHEGWNLVGNPYLTNINLTKSQNVEYDADHVTKFIYHCNALTGNYEVHDMTSYDAEQIIAPFQSYFVQTMVDNSALTITPVAKEEAPTKRTRAYTVNEKQELTLALASGGKEYDKVTIGYDPSASNRFEANEDAAKLWNLTASSPELFATTSDNKSVAVVTSNADKPEDIALGIKAPTADPMQLKVVSINGFSDKRPVIIHDNTTGDDWDPSKSPTYDFTPTAMGNSEEDTENNYVDDPQRFTVKYAPEENQTSVDAVADHGYEVIVEGNLCTVNGLKGNALVAVYNLNGVKVAQEYASTATYTVALADGVYIVVIRENGKEYTSKIMVQ